MPDGTIRKVADRLAFPNGMVITPDNGTLVIAETYGNKLTAFDIASDGSLSKSGLSRGHGLGHRRTWADLPGAYPHGICLDADGAVWYGGVPNKRCVRVAQSLPSREGSDVLQTISLDRGCFSCTLGGVNNATLFMTVND